MFRWRRVGVCRAGIFVLMHTAILRAIHSLSLRTVGECVAMVGRAVIQRVVILGIRPLPLLRTGRCRLRLLATGSPRMAAYIMGLGWLVVRVLPLRSIEIRIRGGRWY